MPKLKQHDLQLWNLYARALGGRCYGCNATDLPLERGHLQRHADSGAGTFDNLIPLCRSCNASRRAGLTEDTRPANWRDILGKLLMEEFGFGLSHTTKNECDHSKAAVTGSQVPQNKRLLDWTEFEFVMANLMCPTQIDSAPLKPKPLTDTEATRLVNTVIQNAETYGLVKPPLAPRKGKMIQLAKGLGADRFKLAANEFLRRKPWDDYDRDPWQILCDNPELYLDYAAQRRRAEAEQRKRQYESNLADRWKRYLWVAAVPDWPDMTDADREVIATAKALVDREPREISDTDMNAAYDVGQRQRNYEAGMIRGRRDKSLKRGERSIRILKLLDNPDPEFAERIKQFVAWILGAKTFNEEDSYESQWSQLEQQLEEALDRQESNRAGVNDLDVVNDPDADEFKRFLQGDGW